MTDVTLDSLIGEHVLDGVDTYVKKVKKYGYLEDANMIRFRLDGVIYVASENPVDGYRSCMDKVVKSRIKKMTNTFPPVRVLARKKPDDRYGGSYDTLELIDLKTGKVVMEVGTDNDDDYYPSFVSNFQPENMSINQR